MHNPAKPGLWSRCLMCSQESQRIRLGADEEQNNAEHRLRLMSVASLFACTMPSSSYIWHTSFTTLVRPPYANDSSPIKSSLCFRQEDSEFLWVSPSVRQGFVPAQQSCMGSSPWQSALPPDSAWSHPSLVLPSVILGPEFIYYISYMLQKMLIIFPMSS